MPLEPKDYKDTIGRCLGLLKIIGITFFEEPKKDSIKNFVRLTAFSITFYPFVLTQLLVIGDISADNFLESARIVPVSLIFVMDIIKLLIGLLKKTQIRDMLLEIGELWPKNLDPFDEKYIIKNRWLWKLKILLNSFFIYAIVNLTLFEAIPFLKSVYFMSIGKNIYLFPFVFNGIWKVDSALIFFLTYLWEFAASFFSQLCIFLPFDLLIVTLTSYISILFRLLQVDMENVIRTRDDDGKALVKQNLSDPHSYNAIRDIIRKHQKLLKLSGKLTEIFGIIVFIHVAVTALVICFFGFLTVVYGGIAETIANLLTVLNAVFTIFLLSLSGQLLCDTSCNVADAAYRSLWYECDSRVKKLILIIITRSQNPCYLSALGFSDMSLRSFSKIMSSSWTYFSLLLQIYKED